MNGGEASASIYFFAGDFADVLRRHEEGAEQIYATHNEVAKLMKELTTAGVDLTIYSFVTPEAREERPLNGLRIVSLGARGYDDWVRLQAAAEKDRSNAIVAHFPNIKLLRAVMATKRRAMAVLANSYNRRGPKPFLERRRVARMLNSPRFELVSNHCLPATNHLATMGVARSKLIPWDVPHRFEPSGTTPKALATRDRYTAAYAGTIRADKGVADLIRVAAQLKYKGVQLHCSFAGGGEIEEMQTLGKQLGVSDQLSFRGLIPNADVFELFHTADVVAVPSHTAYTEGFPLTMFEAIASRTPIVCSDHPMFVPVMKDGANAAVFRAGNVDAFETAISRVLTDVDLYARLSRNADVSWAALKGPADWRTMLTEWILNGPNSEWLQRHTLDRVATGPDNG
jgi:glycosyltransferase involved in cell wall biosynthesis